MKKVVAMLMAIALLVSCAVALADTDLPEKPSPFPYHKDADGNDTSVISYPTFNYDGMILNTKTSKKVKNYNKDWKASLKKSVHYQAGKTVDCEFESVTIDGVLLNICPVCGNVNGEYVMPRVQSSALQVNRVDDTAMQLNTPFVWNTNGQYVVRMMAMPEESEAAYVVTLCHEMGGKVYPAECLYNMILPIDGRNLTLKKAYFGGLTDFKGTVSAQANGLSVRANTPSASFGIFVLMK